MDDSRIAVRYARALFLLAGEIGKVEEVRNDLAQLAELTQSAPEFHQLLQSPLIKPSLKKQMFSQLFKETLEPTIGEFFILLVDHKREQYLTSISRMYNQLYKQEKNIIEGKVTTVRRLDKDAAAILSGWLAREFDATVELSQEENDQIIGGFILQVDDLQLDMSMSTQLKEVRNDLKKSLI